MAAGAAVSAHLGQAERDRVHHQTVVLDQECAAGAGAQRQAVHRNFQGIERSTNHCAGTQVQGLCGDVLVSVIFIVVGTHQSIGIQDAARRGGNAHFAQSQFDVSNGHVGGSQQTRSRCRTGA